MKTITSSEMQMNIALEVKFDIFGSCTNRCVMHVAHFVSNVNLFVL
jgi:hypothetical protein